MATTKTVTGSRNAASDNIALSTGKIITHSIMANGAKSAEPEMSESEWEEYCSIVTGSRNEPTKPDANAEAK